MAEASTGGGQHSLTAAGAGAFVTVIGVLPVPIASRATAAPPSCVVDSAVGLAAAVRAARDCGRTIEDTSLRSATTQVFARADGVLTARISSGPARVRQGNGWADVDLTLVGHPDGSAGSRVHPQNLWLSGPVGAGVHDLVTIGSGSSRLGYGWAGPLPAPVLSGTTARYPDVRPGVDLVIEANRTGFEQSLVVKDRAALAQVASIAFPLRSGGRRLSADGRHLSWRDPVTGEVQVESPEPGAGAVDFFVDVVASGLILTVGPGSSPAQVEEVLGSRYLDDDGDWYLRRDYGLMEFTFLRDRGLACGFVIVEVYRLRSAGLEVVPPAVLGAYPDLPVRVDAQALVAELARVGCEVRRDDDPIADEVRYVAPGTGCVIHVAGADEQPTDGWPAAGEVISISVHDPASDWWQSAYGSPAR